MDELVNCAFRLASENLKGWVLITSSYNHHGVNMGSLFHPPYYWCQEVNHLQNYLTSPNTYSIFNFEPFLFTLMVQWISIIIMGI